MMRAIAAIGLLVFALWAQVAWSQPAAPFESGDWSTPATQIDVAVAASLEKHGIQAASPCSDQTFIRRVYLDAIGTLPEPGDVRAFLEDRRPGKRAALVDALLQRDEFADYWALKWCDVLRVKSEFPINLWPDAAQAYHRWVRDSIRANKPYDQFARELLTSSGSNFRVPPVNFYRAIQGRTPADIAQAVALTFMGTRLESWPDSAKAGMAAFFSRVAYKKTGEWKEEIICLDPTPAGPLDAAFPDGTAVRIGADDDPRQAFADWLIAPDNEWFARSAANRIWAWLMGRGIVHEPDDIRPDNPPCNPELLAYLESELVNAKWDLRHIYRLIFNSRTYQQSAIPRGDQAQAEAFFACYPVRRLDAEVLMDALCWLGGSGVSYSSPIPEPWTFIPDNQRTIDLADGSITSSFLQMFGRPARDTGLASERSNDPNDAQRLYLLNSTDVQQRIERSLRLRTMLAMWGRNPRNLIAAIYLTVLSRYPTQEELAVTGASFQGAGANPRQAVNDLVWALINTKEFLYRH